MKQNKEGDEQMTAEVQVVFKTSLPDEYHVPDIEIAIGTSSTNKEFTQILKQLLKDEGKVQSDDLKGRKFNFMVKNQFINGSLQEHLDKIGVFGEEKVEVWYSFQLDKPKQTHSIPQDEWISTIRSLSHILNEKAKTYVVGFFNGDIKVFDKKNHSELLSVKSLHQDSQVQDALFLKNDKLGKKLLITCSQLPNAELKISEVYQVNKKYMFNQIAQAKDEFNEANDGYKCLSYNPLNNEFICSGYNSTDAQPDLGVLIWKLDNKMTEDESHNEIKKGQKRVKTSISYISPHEKIHVSGGICSLKWAGPTRIYAGCYDHTLKMLDVEKSSIEEILFTGHKVPTCIDAIQEELILTGHEDALIRLWDVRSGQTEKKFKSQYESHNSWISNVKFNNNVENLFISGSYDGTIKLWDLRNEERPLTTLKRKDQDNEYKVMAVEWNGPSQILSGGSDSNITVHSIGEK